MTPKEYDVLIVGSGHSGGMAANILTKQGFSCLMLNAGPESTSSTTASIRRSMSFRTAASASRAAPARFPGE